MATTPLSKNADAASVIPPGIFQSLRRLYRNFTLRVILQSIVTIWAVITFTFFLIRLMPGNPVSVYVTALVNTQNMTYQQASAMAASVFQYNPNTSLVSQYVTYLGQLLQGDMGQSITSPGTKVIDQIVEYLPWTLFSVGLGLLASFGLGIMLGTIMAYKRNSVFDHALSLIASILSAVPNYIWGLLILIVLGVELRWIAVGDFRGTYDASVTPGFTPEFLFSIFKHALLPVLVYVIGTLGSWMLNMRNSTVSTLNEDYINVAKARGLTSSRIAVSYVARNAALPMFTLLAINIGFIIGGSVVIEQLFLYNGIGNFLFLAVTSRDYTSMQGVFLIITISVVLSNLLADLLYSRLDPRVRVGGDK